jgi:hypothetical protein
VIFRPELVEKILAGEIEAARILEPGYIGSVRRYPPMASREPGGMARVPPGPGCASQGYSRDSHSPTQGGSRETTSNRRKEINMTETYEQIRESATGEAGAVWKAADREENNLR